ncbi:hypothetical protein LCGC14_2998640 [marine sediment metagenome]|uniref:ATPase AAA-type core domain-containing protein n=1 Tax=marine sediment metagenome TaxID=412755 RepID=A0A0F8Z9A1_9ZZZZ
MILNPYNPDTLKPLTVFIGRTGSGKREFARSLEREHGFLAIECPEIGLHPTEQCAKVEALVRAAQGNRIVVVTNSPCFLDHCDPKRDSIVIFVNGVGYPLDQGVVDTFCDEFGLGEVWLNEGDARLAGLKKGAELT